MRDCSAHAVSSIYELHDYEISMIIRDVCAMSRRPVFEISVSVQLTRVHRRKPSRGDLLSNTYSAKHAGDSQPCLASSLREI